MNILPLFPNINKDDFNTPIEMFLKYLVSTLDETCESCKAKQPIFQSPPRKKHKKIIGKGLSEKSLIKKELDIDNIKNTLDNKMLYYILCRPNSKIIVSTKKLDNIGKKSFYMKFVNLFLTYQIVDNFKIMLSLFNYNKYEYINGIPFSKGDELFIYFYEDDLNDTDVSKETKNILIKTDNFMETIMYAKMLLNENTYKYLDIQNLRNIWRYKDSINKYIKFVEYIYKNMTLLEIEFLILSSGIVTFYLGVREFGDFDIFIYNNEYTQTIYKKLTDSNFELDICTLSKLIKYKEQPVTCLFLENIFKESMKYMDNINNYNELYFNPICFVQFFGIKIINPRYNIFWRYIRARPSSMSELIAMIIKLKIKVPLFEIPKYNYETLYFVNNPNSKETVKRSPSEYQFYLDAIKLKKTSNKQIPLNENKFIKTTKYYLKQKYNINLNENEIKNIIKDNTNTKNKIPFIKSTF